MRDIRIIEKKLLMELSEDFTKNIQNGFFTGLKLPTNYIKNFLYQRDYCENNNNNVSLKLLPS